MLDFIAALLSTPMYQSLASRDLLQYSLSTCFLEKFWFKEIPQTFRKENIFP